MKKETQGADFKSATDNKKLFIETYGCQMNVADSEVVASIMQMAGYSVCDSLDEADAVFMNTCSIRDNAEQKIINRLEWNSIDILEQNVSTTNLGVACTPSTITCRNVLEAPSRKTCYSLVIVQSVEIEITTCTTSTVCRELVVEIVGVHLYVGLAGEEVTFGERIVWIVVQQVATCEEHHTSHQT